jgi:O-antigen ligase
MTERHGATLDQEGAGGSQDAPTDTGAAVSTLRRIEPAILADRVVEACILLACVSVPLYFPGGTSIPADAHKSVPLIAIAAVAAAAWLVGAAASHDGWIPAGTSRPLLWAGVSLLLAYALATILSIHPLVSVVGTLARRQGLLTHAAYAAIFVCAATRVRSREQLDRLFAGIIVGSAPIALYGIAQQAGIDPLPSAGDLSTVQWPVRASFGNHVFLGAYLVLLIPLVSAALIQSLHDDAGGQDRRWALPAGVVPPLVASLAYLGYLTAGARNPSLFAVMPALLGAFALLGVALHAVWSTPGFARGRTAAYGLILALLVAVLIMTSARGALLGVLAALPVFALLAAWRLRRPRMAAAILGCVVVVGLFVLVLNIPGGPLQPLRTVHALNRVANVGEYASESSGAGRLLVWHGFATLMTEHPAVGNTWGGIGRDLVGYGPESQAQAFEAVFPLKLRVETAETYTWDSAHSMYLDILVDAGALAVLVFAITVILFFARALRAVIERRERASWLTIGLIAAVVGQLAEGVFGVEAAGSLVILWLVLGLGAAPPVSGPSAGDSRASSTTWVRSAAAYAAGVLVFLLVALLVDLGAHPTIFAAIWLAGILAGAGGIAWMISTRPPGSAEPIPENASQEPGRRNGVRAAVGVLALAALASLVFPWQTESAATAETAGLRHIDRSDVTQGLALLQQAARTQGYEPKYREDLAVVYFALAQRNTPTGAPGYVPSGNDALTIDPGGAQALGRDQLFALGVLSLQGAESLDPLDPYVHELIGNAYLQWGRMRLARAEFQRAERLSHDNPRYIDDLAIVSLDESQLQPALVKAQQAMQLDPTFWYSYYTRALIEQQMQRGGPAASDARMSLILIGAAHATPSPAQSAALHRLASG